MEVCMKEKPSFTEKLHAILAVLFLVEKTQLMNSNRHSINFRALFYEHHCIFLDLGTHTTGRVQTHHMEFAAPNLQLRDALKPTTT
jgi:hypothetical protein